MWERFGLAWTTNPAGNAERYNQLKTADFVVEPVVMQNSATTKYVQEGWANDMVARAKMVQEGWTRESKTKKLLKLAIKRDHVARTELA